MRRLLDVYTDEEKRLKTELFDLTMQKQRLEREIQELKVRKQKIETNIPDTVVTNTTGISNFPRWWMEIHDRA